MFKITIQSLLVLCCFCLCSCFQDASSSEEEAEEALIKIETEDNDGSDVDISISGLQDAAKQVEESLKTLNNGEKVELINFRDLKKMLPEKLLGMERTSHKGEKAGAMGFNVSSAEAKYKDGDKSMEIKLTDMAGVGIAKLGTIAWASMEIDSESDEGFQRTFTENNVKYMEEFNTINQSYSLQGYAGERLGVDVKSRNVDPKKVRKLITNMKFHKLY